MVSETPETPLPAEVQAKVNEFAYAYMPPHLLSELARLAYTAGRQATEAERDEAKEAFGEMHRAACEESGKAEAAEAPLTRLREALTESQEQCEQAKATLRLVLGKHEMGVFTLPAADVERAEAVITDRATPRIIGERWDDADVGHGVLYGRCPSCGVARVTEWCPPPCNTQSARYSRGFKASVPERKQEARAALTSEAGDAPPPQHRCSGCGHRWQGGPPGPGEWRGAELCGDCWRTAQPVLQAAGEAGEQP